MITSAFFPVPTAAMQTIYFDPDNNAYDMVYADGAVFSMIDEYISRYDSVAEHSAVLGIAPEDYAEGKVVLFQAG